MSIDTRSDQIEAWQFLDSLGANDEAVSWARSFGPDLRRMWNACDHGELMSSIMMAMSVPLPLALWSCIDIVRDSVSDVRMGDANRDALRSIGVWLSSNCDLDLDTMMRDVTRLMNDAEERDDGIVAMVGHVVTRMILAIQHLDHNGCHGFAMAVMAMFFFASKVRTTVMLVCGNDDRPVDVIDRESMGYAADVIRGYVPYEVLVSAVLRLAMGSELEAISA